MPSLKELDAKLLKREDDNSSQYVDSVAEADGLMFLCPKCFKENGGKVGTHSVICWFKHVPPHIDPKPGRWHPQGSTIDDITFVGPGAASVLLTSGCKWHGFVKNGHAD